jgi:hypothetical protein
VDTQDICGRVVSTYVNWVIDSLRAFPIWSRSLDVKYCRRIVHDIIIYYVWYIIYMSENYFWLFSELSTTIHHLHPSLYITHILSTYHSRRWYLLSLIFDVCLRIIFDNSLDILQGLQYWYPSVNITWLFQQPSVRKAELLSSLCDGLSPPPFHCWLDLTSEQSEFGNTRLRWDQ